MISEPGTCATAIKSEATPVIVIRCWLPPNQIRRWILGLLWSGREEDSIAEVLTLFHIPPVRRSVRWGTIGLEWTPSQIPRKCSLGGNGDEKKNAGELHIM